MEVITIENQAFSKLLSNLENLTREIHCWSKGSKEPLGATLPKTKLSLRDMWLDSLETCQELNIARRTLQAYRDKKIIPYSQIGGKIYYKASDIQTLLEKNYITLNPP